MTIKIKVATGIIALFYISGVIGILIPSSREWFLSYTPLNLVLTACLYVWANDVIDKKIMLAFVFTFLAGFFIEVAGVHTGMLFGEYTYGQPLGWKLWDVPLTIGINWFLLSLSSYSLSKHYINNKILVPICGALIMTLLDVLIEPVAIELDFWSWSLVTPPLQNYFMWFIVALFIHSFLEFIRPKTNVMMAIIILSSQLFFFGVLFLLG